MANKVKPVGAGLKKRLKKAAKKLAIRAPGLLAESKAYEAWLAFETALALRKAHADVNARSHAEKGTKTFWVRGAPGNLPYIGSTDPQEPCHFQIDWHGASVELHISLNHEREPGDNRHELDISVVPRDFARHGRIQHYGGPYWGPRLVGAELKAYRVEKPLDKNIARALIGLVLDLDPGSMLPKIEFKGPAGKSLLVGRFDGPNIISSPQPICVPLRKSC